LHTPDAQATIMRVVSMFPPEEQEGVRLRLAESLYAVVSQRLLPRADGNGRVVACEVMRVTSTMRDLIGQQRISEIRDFIAEGREQYGMQTFDQHLADLVTQGVVTFDVALAASTRPADFQLKMNMLQQSPAMEPMSTGELSISMVGGGMAMDDRRSGGRRR
jgi:twitching motility protein PilT